MEKNEEFTCDNTVSNLGDWISNPKLIAEKLLSKTAVTCSLTIPIQDHDPTTGKTSVTMTTVPFYMENDFNLGTLGNEWKDLVDINGENAFINLLNATSILSGNAQVTPQSEAMSSKVYKGSTFSGFNINCLFVATRRTMDPTKILQYLAAATLPGKAIHGDPSVNGGIDAVKNMATGVINFGEGFINYAADGAQSLFKIDADKVSGFKQTVSEAADFSRSVVEDIGMVAPLQYGIEYNKETHKVGPRPYTTVMLQVGDYFRAPGLLVSGVNSITFSKEVIKPINPNNGKNGHDIYDNSPQGNRYGFPLYMRCTIGLVPCSMMHLNKFRKYFIDPTNKTEYSKQDRIIADAAQLP